MDFQIVYKLFHQKNVKTEDDRTVKGKVEERINTSFCQRYPLKTNNGCLSTVTIW